MPKTHRIHVSFLNGVNHLTMKETRNYIAGMSQKPTYHEREIQSCVNTFDYILEEANEIITDA